MLSEWINPEYLKEESIVGIHNTFCDAQPFEHLVLSDFFIEEKLEEVLEELGHEDFHEKQADLFSFLQTNDLVGSESEIIKSFRAFLCSEEFIGLMYKITDLQLKPGIIDLHSTIYRDTDYLLCHDDQLDERRIAFLLYLSDMEDDEGGSLNLYSEKSGLPREVVKKIVPKFNTFAFFKVSEVSFHEVEEVVVDKSRLAIGGWLHE